MTDAADVLRLEPDDLDGHTIDELSEYLDAGRTPLDSSIEASPACRMALAALQRLRDLAGAYLADQGSSSGETPGWIAAVLAAIPIDAKAGRRFPMPVDDDRIVASITEGAIRGLVRAVGDAVPGLLVGAVRLGSVGSTTLSPTALSIDVAIAYGTVVETATDALRQALRVALADHVPFAIGPIDVRVTALIQPRSDGRESRDE